MLLNNLMDGIMYIMRINVKAPTFPAEQPFLDLRHHAGSLEGLAVGKRMEVAAELDISQRMVAYYESAGATPPAHTCCPPLRKHWGCLLMRCMAAAPQCAS